MPCEILLKTVILEINNEPLTLKRLTDNFQRWAILKLELVSKNKHYKYVEQITRIKRRTVHIKRLTNNFHNEIISSNLEPLNRNR